MVQAEGVQFQYSSDGPRMTFPDFACASGDRLLLLGQSGTGKTTLLHLLAGMLRTDMGTIHVAGRDLSASSDRELDAWRGQELGIVFQRAHFVQSLTVEENLALPHQLTRGHVLHDLLDTKLMNGTAITKWCMQLAPAAVPGPIPAVSASRRPPAAANHMRAI